MASISTRMLAAGAAVSAIALVAPPARADVLEKSTKVGGVTVHYKVVLPSGYDRRRHIQASSRSAAVRRR